MLLPLLILYCEKRHGNNSPLQNYSSLKAKKTPNWVTNGILYQLYIRAFTPEGTIAAATERLPELKALGVNIIWLMPVCPIGEQGRKGSDGCPYSIADFRAVNPKYGTTEDLKRFVEVAHRLELKVILGMVPNHGSNDNVLLASHPDWFMRDSSGQYTRKVEDWSDITDFNYENPDMRQYMLETFVYWIQEFDFDGFRMDVAGMVPLDFWQESLPELRRVKQDIFLLAEWEKPELILAGFNADYDWTLLHYLKSMVNGEKSIHDILNMVITRDSLYPRNALPMRFLENHDEQRVVAEFGRENSPVLAPLLFTLPGVPLIYNGQEIGAVHRPSLFEKDPIDWQNGDSELEQLYRKLIKMRLTHPVLSNGTMAVVKTIPHLDDVAAFIRSGKDETALVVVNAGNSAHSEIRLDLGKLGFPAKTVSDLFNEETILSTVHGQLFNIKAQTTHVFIISNANRRKQ